MQFSVFFAFADKTEYCENFSKDLFMRTFHKYLCLRSSCYQCGFKTINRNSDITIADFWGVQKIAPEMFDDKGTSLILLQSPKGKGIFDRIKSDVGYLEVDCKKSIQCNSAAFRSVAKPVNRNKFMENIDIVPYDKLVRKYARISLFKKIISITRRVYRKLK